jgi:hypothetical protein
VRVCLVVQCCYPYSKEEKIFRKQRTWVHPSVSHFGAMRRAPSIRMTSPFSMGFSMMDMTSSAYLFKHEKEKKNVYGGGP